MHGGLVSLPKCIESHLPNIDALMEYFAYIYQIHQIRRCAEGGDWEDRVFQVM